MCTPIIGTVLTIVSTGLQIASGIAQSNAIRAEGEDKNNYYNYLADTNEQQALLAKKTGRDQSKVVQDIQKVQGKRLKLDQARFRGSQEAALAASGITLSSVTSGDILKDTLNNQAIDENMLRYNADVKSYEAFTGAENQAFGLRNQATGYRYAGSNALKASKTSARNTLLGTAASVISPFIFRPFTSSAKTTGRPAGVSGPLQKSGVF